MIQYIVTGMSCAACSARVEKAVSKVPGVTSCSVSLLTNSMGVEGTATEQEIIKAVADAGYGASKQGEGAAKAQPAQDLAGEDMLKDRETPVLKRRLIASVGFLIVLMYFSMGHMMWGWPVPGFMKDNHVMMGLLQMLLTIIVMVINQKVFHQWIQRTDSPGTEYGYPGGTWIRSVFCIQYVCTVCNDRCADAWGYGCSNVLYA